ncbi:hypothetical protein MRB53_003304 [Persea americana]|uniref:Uncharacterized protein n=1 Tax=Persea americana TaxID=3435 RepID=A0ACC2MX69_PERAE|nr:hypothetical protein MRB53_003304 [Persea americana]
MRKRENSRGLQGRRWLARRMMMERVLRREEEDGNGDEGLLGWMRVMRERRRFRSRGDEEEREHRGRDEEEEEEKRKRKVEEGGRERGAEGGRPSCCRRGLLAGLLPSRQLGGVRRRPRFLFEGGIFSSRRSCTWFLSVQSNLTDHAGVPADEDFASSKFIKVRFHEQQMANLTPVEHFCGLTHI